jgi:hypothetical protein
MGGPSCVMLSCRMAGSANLPQNLHSQLRVMSDGRLAGSWAVKVRIAPTADIRERTLPSRLRAKTGSAEPERYYRKFSKVSHPE